MRPSLTAVAALALALTAGCSSSAPPAAEKDSSVPKGFDVPSGVTITKAGSTLAVGDAASVVWEVGGDATSAVTVTVTQIRKGKIKDFRFFSLDDATKTSTPYYVKATVTNEGPAGLGGTALPVFAHDSSNTIFPPNELVGTFKPCRNPSLPKSLLPDKTAKICLVFLVDKGKTLETIDVQAGAEKDAIRWTP